MLKRISEILLLAISGCALARADRIPDSDTVTVKFRQSHSQIDLGFSDNGEHLTDLLRQIRGREQGDSVLAVKKVKVRGGASPEGSIMLNRDLSYRRAESIFNWLSNRVEIEDSLVGFEYLGRDWNGLLNYVLADPEVPCRGEVLDLVRRVAEAPRPESGGTRDYLAQLKEIGGGLPYSYLYRHAFPGLRESSVIIEYGMRKGYTPFFPQVGQAVIPLTPHLLSPGIYTESMENLADRHPCRPFYMAVKTNLLYDALALPNIGVEFYLGRAWSISADWTYGWWDDDSAHRYWRAYGGEVALRRWFGRKAYEKPLTGHHLGIYAGAITYDFEFGSTGYMGGIPGGTLWDRCNWYAGIEYGYSLPVARRLNIDFTLGIGYLGGKYIKYEPKNGYYRWESTNRLNWFGPTKAEISLVWLIGCDNYNRPKGGGK